MFARFVSTIPFLEDAQVSQGQVKDVWCNSKEFITLAAGDWEEHAILLNNYYTVRTKLATTNTERKLARIPSCKGCFGAVAHSV